MENAFISSNSSNDVQSTIKKLPIEETTVINGITYQGAKFNDDSERKLYTIAEHMYLKLKDVRDVWMCRPTTKTLDKITDNMTRIKSASLVMTKDSEDHIKLMIYMTNMLGIDADVNKCFRIPKNATDIEINTIEKCKKSFNKLHDIIQTMIKGMRESTPDIVSHLENEMLKHKAGLQQVMENFLRS